MIKNDNDGLDFENGICNDITYNNNHSLRFDEWIKASILK